MTNSIKQKRFFDFDFPEKQTNKRHYRVQRGEIQQNNLFHLDENQIPTDRILGVSDIKGARTNTLMSQAVRNRLVAKNMRQNLLTETSARSPYLKEEMNQNIWKDRQKFYLNKVPIQGQSFKPVKDSIDEVINEYKYPKVSETIGIQTSSKNIVQKINENHLIPRYSNMASQSKSYPVTCPTSPTSNQSKIDPLKDYSQIVSAMQKIKKYNPSFLSHSSQLLQDKYFMKLGQRSLKF